MAIKKTLLAAALSGLSMASAEANDNKNNLKKSPDDPAANKPDTYVATPSKDRPMGNYPSEEKCYGINKCQAYTFCGVLKEDIDAANKVFQNKFKNSISHGCSMEGKCAASKGHLGFTYVKKGTCIKVHKGFYIEVDDKGKSKVITGEVKG